MRVQKTLIFQVYCENCFYTYTQNKILRVCDHLQYPLKMKFWIAIRRKKFEFRGGDKKSHIRSTTQLAFLWEEKL